MKNFEGSKDERRQQAFLAGILEKQRYCFSKNPELVRKMELFRNAIGAIEQKYPDFLGATIYGSQVLGYADVGSDFDSNFFIEIPGYETMPIWKRNNFSQDWQKKLRLEIPSEFKWPGQTAENVPIYFVSPGEIHKEIELLNYILKQNQQSKLPPAFNPAAELAGLFCFSIGKGVVQYRTQVIHELSQLGEEGEAAWAYLAESLWNLENGKLDKDLAMRRKQFYPMTLEGAKQEFYK